MQASLRLEGVQGEKIVPVAEFFTGNGRFPNILSEGRKQIVTEIIIPLPRSGERFA